MIPAPLRFKPFPWSQCMHNESNRAHVDGLMLNYLLVAEGTTIGVHKARCNNNVVFGYAYIAQNKDTRMSQLHQACAPCNFLSNLSVVLCAIQSVLQTVRMIRNPSSTYRTKP